MQVENEKTHSWLDKPLSSFIPSLNIETLLIAMILVLAIVSRFYNIDLRVMSHDEVNHVVPSWDLYQGQIYRHDPVTHGPLQFHLVALSYFIFGDSDFSSRVPVALFSIATVAVAIFAFRRYLGRIGALIAGILFLISPYMLYYGRYTRNEAFVALFGMLTLYAVLRYLDRGDRFSLFLLTAVTALQFATKETSYIYTAQLLLFLVFLFFERLVSSHWKDTIARKRFIFLVGLGLILIILALGLAAWDATLGLEGDTPTAPAQSEAEVETIPSSVDALTAPIIGMFVVFGVAILVFISAGVLLVRTMGWEKIRSHRTFDLLMLVGTLILPQLSAFPVKLLGWDPLDYSNVGMARTGFFVVIIFALSVLLGLWWKRRLWLLNAAVFYSIFIVLYTSFFTNGQGFFTGLIGSLGYWLAQHDVQRGSQPLYYYMLVQIPLYEYLAALGTMLAVFFGLYYRRFSTIAGFSPAHQPELMDFDEGCEPDAIVIHQKHLPVLALLIFWSVSALFAYTYAGEKMPWLTVHIALPFLMSAAWGFGYLAEIVDWKKVFNQRGLIVLLLIPIFLSSVAGVIGSFLGVSPPFRGNTLEQLQSTNTFILSFIAAVASCAGVIWLLRGWNFRRIISLGMAVVFILLALLTTRHAYMASYINYDNAKEYLVYAHAARGPKDILEQVEEISRRTTGGLDIQVAYDNDGLYPYWWYFRNYPNHHWFTDTPTRDLRDYPLIVAGNDSFGKLEPIVRDNFVQFEYIRLWWPNQDYFNLTWERIWDAVSDPMMRAAIFDIWLNRDYTRYAEATGKDAVKLETWQPSEQMRFYVRKDVVGDIWNYGAAPVVSEVIDIDPYEGKIIDLLPDSVFGIAGNEPGAFNSPRNLAFAPNGTIYIADAYNHRIQHFSADGELLHVWGSFASVDSGAAPGGTFNEPWGITVGLDGSVYVSDTWNHRIQKFTSNGEFITMWGYFGQADSPTAFYGPRGLALDDEGNVYLADTGNKRVVVFDPSGVYLTQFGTPGMALGQFDEPVGVALDPEGNVYVTDTWNQRIQVFASGGDLDFYPLLSWDVSAWFGQSLDNKPFIAVDDSGNVFVTDPEGYRVLQFDTNGNFIRGWGDYSSDVDGFGMPVGITVDAEGKIWVSDAGNHRILRFTLPEP